MSTTISLTISSGALTLLLGSAVLFVVAAVLTRPFREQPDSTGLGLVFTLLGFAMAWAIPSLVAWALWATWLR